MSLKDDLTDIMLPLIGGTVIWLDQNKPRPALPYCGIKVMSRRRVKRDHYDNPDDDGFQVVKGDREFTFSVQSFGYDEPTEILQNVADKLLLQTVNDKFYAKGLVAFNVGGVLDVSSLLDKTQIEKRASLDIFIRYKVTQTDNVGIIETVDVEGRDNGVGSPVYHVVVTV